MTQLSRLHMDPDHPVPGTGDGGMLTDVDDELIDALIDSVVGSPILSAEIRHLGGAIARPRPEHGAVAAFEAPFSTFAVGVVPTPEAHALVHAAIARFRAALAPWEAQHTYLNLAESRRSAATLFTEAAYRRLRRIKAAYDPTDLIRSNHPLA